MEQRIILKNMPIHSINRLSWVWNNYTIRPISCVDFQNNNWSLKGRQVSDCFFLYVYKGCLRVQLGDVELKVMAGSILVLPDGMYHQLESWDQSKDIHQIALHAHINNTWGESLFSKTTTRVFKLSQADYWLNTLRTTSTLLQECTSIGLDCLHSQLHTLITELLVQDLDLDTSPTNKDARIEHALELISSRIDHDWTVEELARISHLGVVQFRTIFKKHLNITPKIYIHRKRVQESCHLLQHGTLKIKEIAALVGFQSDYYFQRSFKQIMGCTPTQYRTQERI